MAIAVSGAMSTVVTITAAMAGTMTVCPMVPIVTARGKRKTRKKSSSTSPVPTIVITTKTRMATAASVS